MRHDGGQRRNSDREGRAAGARAREEFGRVGAYDSKSRDWVASMALADKLFPDHKE